VLGPDHLDTLTTRYCIARELAARSDHIAAEAEYRDVLAIKLRVLGWAARRARVWRSGCRVSGRAGHQATGARSVSPVHADHAAPYRRRVGGAG
jgi:hypothetical protein